MQITTDNLFRAYLKSRTLHENLLTADTLLRYTHGKVPPDSPIIRAKADLRELADAMGFDLVERMTADEASRLAGAPTWKSPLDGKFAPEFLGDTPNGTTMGFR